MEKGIVMKGVHSVPENTPRTERSQMDTILITPDGVDALKHPPFQRPIKVNKKVEALVQEIKANGGCIPGIVTLGIFQRERYVIDGQHRLEAFKISGVPEGLCDVRLKHFDSLGDMGEEFVNLNSSLVKMRPDDILRGMEGVHEGLQILRKRCRFIGYDQIRRGTAPSAPMLSMTMALRSYYGAMREAPAGGGSAMEFVKRLSVQDAEEAATFFCMCHEAWASDLENRRLWTALNLTMVGWLYRNTVLAQRSVKSERVTPALFQKFLVAVAADAGYNEWIIGRALGERDRSPAYARLKTIMVRRLQIETGKKVHLPQPAWATSH